EICRRDGPLRVLIIRNEENLGFPAGCNQGLAQARGRDLIFLNNDTVVTQSWLEGLVHWSLEDWAKIGLVGPVSNSAPRPQQIAISYESLADMQKMAARRKAEHGTKALQVDRLTGFCLLVRREVLDRIGGFDEQYGLGFFDDDDLCLRAREEGFLL